MLTHSQFFFLVELADRINTGYWVEALTDSASTMWFHFAWKNFSIKIFTFSRIDCVFVLNLNFVWFLPTPKEKPVTYRSMYVRKVKNENKSVNFERQNKRQKWNFKALSECVWCSVIEVLDYLSKGEHRSRLSQMLPTPFLVASCFKSCFSR